MSQQNNPIPTLLLYTGSLLIVAGAVMPIFEIIPAIAPYLMIAGGLSYTAAQCLSRPGKGSSVTLRRLYRMQLLGALAFVVAGILMCCDVYSVGGIGGAEWQASLAIGAALQIYTAFRIPAENK